MKTIFPCILLALAVSLVGCGSTLDERSVREFIDHADEAARKRYAPEICGLRGATFTQELHYQHLLGREPSESKIGRKLYCRQAAQFARLYQYQLERRSLDVKMAGDGKTASVVAEYKEILPHYEAGVMAATPDSFTDFIVIESRDESVVGVEDGELVFLSARVDAREIELIPKSQLHLPYQ